MSDRTFASILPVNEAAELFFLMSEDMKGNRSRYMPEHVCGAVVQRCRASCSGLLHQLQQLQCIR